MAAGLRDLGALLLRWFSHWKPPPVAGPYRVAAGGCFLPGAAAAGVFFPGIAAGEAHEY